MPVEFPIQNAVRILPISARAEHALGLGPPKFVDFSDPDIQSEDVTFPVDTPTFLDVWAHAHRQNLSEEELRASDVPEDQISARVQQGQKDADNLEFMATTVRQMHRMTGVELPSVQEYFGNDKRGRETLNNVFRTIDREQDIRQDLGDWDDWRAWGPPDNLKPYLDAPGEFPDPYEQKHSPKAPGIYGDYESRYDRLGPGGWPGAGGGGTGEMGVDEGGRDEGTDQPFDEGPAVSQPLMLFDQIIKDATAQSVHVPHAPASAR